MSDEVICSYKPELVTGPIGMFHCPECGEMVVAGAEHPDYALLEMIRCDLMEPPA